MLITGLQILVLQEGYITREETDGYYEPLDLQISNEAEAAGLSKTRPALPKLRVATKYPRVANNYYQEIGIQAEIITLYGSMELAPIVGLADEIVDLVDTGKTLEANNLFIIENIQDISSRLIVNKAALKVKPREIGNIIDELQVLIKEKDG